MGEERQGSAVEPSAGAPTATIAGLAGADDGWCPRKGDLFGRYVILQPIGRGGMGAVYAAYDPELDRKVAIKILLAGSARSGHRAAAHRRLRREAQALAQLNHPNVLAVFDVGEVEERVFIATELVEGQDLRRWLAVARPRRQIVRTFVAAGNGLAAAHRAGIVHRDFKPSNVMISTGGRVRVVDFGLAQLAGKPSGGRSSVRSGGAPAPGSTSAVSVDLGTPAYMAPEQLEGRAATDRSDQYAFCLALFEALYGQLPAGGLNAAIPQGPIEIPSRSRAGRVPGPCRRVLRRGLAPAAEDRFESMPELLDVLGARPWTPRWPVWVVSAGAVVAVSSVMLRPDPAARCSGGVEKLARVWSADLRATVARTVGAGVGAGGGAFADEAARSTLDALDAYGNDWAAMHQTTCLATHRRGEQSEALLDLRMACLDRRLSELGALGQLLAKPDAVTPERAVRAARGLEPLARCADVRALLARQAPPTGAPALGAIADLEIQLAAARAEHQAGRYPDGLVLAEAVAEAASRLTYWPLRAEALIRLGGLQTSTARASEAAATFEQALLAAVAGNDHRAAAEAAIELVRVTGYQLADMQRGDYFAAHARAMLEQLSAPAELAGKLDDYVGTLRFQQGDYPLAIEHHERALEAKRAVRGDAHPEVATTLTRLGNVVTAQGKHAAALAYFEQALAINRQALGPNHPNAAASLDRVGAAHFNLAQYDDAAAAHQQALKVRRSVLGAEHPRVASTLINLGNVEWERGHYEESLEHYVLARRIFEVAQGEGHPNVALALSNEGNALLRLHRFDEAITRYETARDVQVRVYGEGHNWVATTDLNLGDALLERGDPRAALDRYRAARAVWEKLHDADHYSLGDVLSGEGRALLDTRQPRLAAAVLEQALAIRERSERDPTRLGVTRFALARALGALDQSAARARSLAAAARDAFERNPAKNHDVLAEVVVWLEAHPAPLAIITDESPRKDNQ